MKKSTGLSTRVETFVDTSGFYALLVKSDPMHERARDLLGRTAQSSGRFLTTDYILDETATLLKARGYGYLGESFFARVFASAACQIAWMDSDSFARTRYFFLKYHDQAWSFTDCFSFHVMRLRGLHRALTTDMHFRQAGFQPLLI